KFTRTDARGRTTIIPQLERQVTGHAISRITLQDNGKKQTQTIALENKLGAAQLLAKLQGFVKDQIETTNVTTQMEVSPEQMSAIMNDPEKAALMRALALQLSLPESNQAQPGEKKNEQDPKSDS
ncbi:hypothetical protein, partial [Staphylococcus capitis]|uniref:hypothetical protein n=1 Tax=Staphylococcus capitis TaxID=29388 RepID=UPI00145BC1E6